LQHYKTKYKLQNKLKHTKMKTLKLIVIGIVLFLANPIHAQVSVSLNIGSPPMWGPVGYTEARYYYLPDVQAYYDVQASMFIYNSGGAWIHRTYLPARYRNYDLYGGYKVVMNDYRGNTPYTHFKEHKRQYARGYHGQAQRTIGERPGRGNNKARYSNDGNHENKGGRNNSRNERRGNDNKRNQGGGEGRRK
jgi:hypothetical protein